MIMRCLVGLLPRSGKVVCNKPGIDTAELVKRRVRLRWNCLLSLQTVNDIDFYERNHKVFTGAYYRVI